MRRGCVLRIRQAKPRPRVQSIIQSKRVHLDGRKLDPAAIHATLTPYVRDWTLHFRFIDFHLLFGQNRRPLGRFGPSPWVVRLWLQVITY